MDIKVVRSITIVGLALSMAVVSCTGDRNGPTGGNRAALITEVTVSPSRIRVGDEVSLTIVLRNEGTQTVDLMFASGQQYDFLIEDDSSVLGRHAGIYTRATTQMRLIPGQSRSRQFNFRIDPSASSLPMRSESV